MGPVLVQVLFRYCSRLMVLSREVGGQTWEEAFPGSKLLQFTVNVPFVQSLNGACREAGKMETQNKCHLKATCAFFLFGYCLYEMLFKC